MTICPDYATRSGTVAASAASRPDGASHENNIQRSIAQARGGMSILTIDVNRFSTIDPLQQLKFVCSG